MNEIVSKNMTRADRVIDKLIELNDDILADPIPRCNRMMCIQYVCNLLPAEGYDEECVHCCNK